MRGKGGVDREEEGKWKGGEGIVLGEGEIQILNLKEYYEIFSSSHLEQIIVLNK